MADEGFFDAKLGELFTSRREKGAAGLPTLSVMIDGGLQDRDSLDRKMETNLSPEDHLLVRPGDIAYNMMRMWQGASGLSTVDAIVSPAYVVLTPTQRVDPLFASYFFKSSRAIYLFWAYSQGLTRDRLRLYFDDFSQIPVRVPSLAQQRKIAEILATWDRSIEVVEQLIENSKVQRAVLVDRLFDRRAEHVCDGWEAACFDEIFVVANNKRTQVKGEDYCAVGRTPVVDQGQDYVAGYTDQTAVYGDIPVIVFGDHTKAVKFVDFPFCPGADGTQILKTTDKISPRFGYHLLSALELPNLGYSRHMRELKDATFRYPTSAADQAAISGILDASESALGNLHSQLDKLRAEKSALMHELLAGNRRVNVRELAA